MQRRRDAFAVALTIQREAIAQSEASPSEPPQEQPIEVVVTGTRTKESSQRATVRAGIVTREEAERRGATDVGEALAGELGLEVNPRA